MTEENQDLGTIEERAKRMGHVSQEEFRGNPENWVDAETFVRRAEESLPILKGTLTKMEQKMADQERQMKTQAEEFKTAMASLKGDLSEFVEFSKGAEQRAYQKALKELKAEQTKAKNAGDLDAFVEATDKIDSLIAEHPAVTGKGDPKPVIDPKPQAQPTGVQEQFQQWIASDPNAFDEWKAEKDNAWYQEDPDMAVYADSMDRWLINTKYVKDGFKMSRRDHLAEVTKLVKKKFPDFFGNPARRVGSMVESDTGGAPGGNGKQTYSDLPEDARKQCDKWAGKDGKGTGTMGPNFTRADYL
ncbi:MAG TPA: hypothetical protein VIY48_07680, partial [Candidatus Paceibacterota bacterium]